MSRIQAEQKVQWLREENEFCYDRLLDLEMQIVEQLEVGTIKILQ